MALTETQKQQAREYLGIPTVTGAFNLGSPGVTFDERIASLAGNTAAEDSFKALLAAITTSRTDIEAARGRLKAAEVGDIKLNPKELRQRWREDLELCERMARIINMEVVRHPAIKSGSPRLAGV